MVNDDIQSVLLTGDEYEDWKNEMTSSTRENECCDDDDGNVEQQQQRRSSSQISLSLPVGIPSCLLPRPNPFTTAPFRAIGKCTAANETGVAPRTISNWLLDIQ
jgi:hypothetical protein